MGRETFTSTDNHVEHFVVSVLKDVISLAIGRARSVRNALNVRK